MLASAVLLTTVGTIKPSASSAETEAQVVRTRDYFIAKDLSAHSLKLKW